MYNGIPSPCRSNMEWRVILENVHKSRRIQDSEKKSRSEELEILKAKLKHFHQEVHNLKCELQSTKQKLESYEVVIEDLKAKNELNEKNFVIKEKNLKTTICKLELDNRNLTKKQKHEHLEVEKEYKNAITQLEMEKEHLCISVLNLQKLLNEIKNKNEDMATAKLLTNSKAELSKLRILYESSERDRLSERKEKLSVMQNMIQLTKKLSDLDNEQEYKKAEEFANIKYVRLFEKYQAAMLKLRSFYETAEYEKKELKKKYLDEICSLKIRFEKELRDIYTEKITAQESLELFLKNNQFCSTIYDDVIEEENSKDKPKEVSGEFNVPDKQILDDLFNQYSGIYKRCEENSNLLKGKNIDGHTSEINKKSPEENPVLKIDHQADCQVEIKDPAIKDLAINDPAINDPAIKDPAINDPAIKDPAINDPAINDPAINDLAIKDPAINDPAIKDPAINDLAIKDPAINDPAIKDPAIKDPAIKDPAIKDPAINDPAIKDPAINDLEIAERAFKSQIESLLDEIKHSSIKLQQITDDVDSYKTEIADLRKEKKDLEELSKSQLAQIFNLNETISSLTHNLKMAELSIESLNNHSKDIEISRLETDFKEMEENFCSAKESCKELNTEINEQKILTQQKEIELVFLKKKLIELEQTNETIALQLKHSEEECGILQNTLNDKENTLLECNAMHMHCNENLELLKKEITILEVRLQEKLDLLSSKALEIELIQTELLATKYLLSEEEKKSEELDKALKKIAENMEEKKTEEFVENLKKISKNMEEKKIEELDKTINKASENMEEKKSEELDKNLKKISENIEEKNIKEFDKTINNTSENMEEKKSEDLDENRKKTSESMEKKRTEGLDKNLKKISKNMKEKKREELDKTLKKISENMEEHSKINLDENHKNEIESFKVENDMKIKNCSNKLQMNADDLNNSVDGLKNATDRFCDISNESQCNADGLACLNNLIVDNEIFSKYLEEQSYLLNNTKLENQNLKIQLQELYATIMVYDNSLEEKKKFNEEMHVRWKTESKIKKEFEQEILLLKEHVKLLNDEIKQYEIKLKTKDEEMEKLNEELLMLQKTHHYQQSNMLLEKKAIESLENQIKKINEDHSIALHELNTTQLLNQMLQARVKELQRWQNNIEVDFFKYKDNLSPHQMIEENLKSRDKFFTDCLVQVKEKISKYYASFLSAII
ncbi:putative autophagy-related protein 11 isoform X2 [Hydra vulgaris]|uniref:putative autophagy-related protein 11 isoform X2 n=1 Tax=Hydra vulgaris TaxID=6087 RepID=UPI001F5F9F5A|nr:putative autophagy-related protein 11 isoform X2 [Hydra vulgaris]